MSLIVSNSFYRCLLDETDEQNPVRVIMFGVNMNLESHSAFHINLFINEFKIIKKDARKRYK